MNQWTTYIYLFFLKECCGINNTFFEKTFQFHRFLSLEKKVKWERLFWTDESGNLAKDVELENVLRTLIHHGFVQSSYEINAEGLNYLKKIKEEQPKMPLLLNEFLEKYQNGTLDTKSCFLKEYSFPVACHLCQERVCVNNSLTMKDFGRLLNFKGLKNPYKKRIYNNPHFE